MLRRHIPHVEVQDQLRDLDYSTYQTLVLISQTWIDHIQVHRMDTEI